MAVSETKFCRCQPHPSLVCDRRNNKLALSADGWLDGLLPRCFCQGTTSRGWTAKTDLTETEPNKDGGPVLESRRCGIGNLAPNSRRGTIVASTNGEEPEGDSGCPFSMEAQVCVAAILASYHLWLKGSKFPIYLS